MSTGDTVKSGVRAVRSVRGAFVAAKAVTETEETKKASKDLLGESMDDSGFPKDEKEYDIFRDSLLRYMGYANECGEAFVAWLPVWGVPATYGVAATYVLMDTVDKGVKRWNKAEGEEDRAKQALAVATETVTWQMLASVFWPGSFIRVVVASTNLALTKVDTSAFDALAAQGLDVEKLLPTIIGLAAIPFIVHPIDTTVDKAADMSFAKALRGEMKGGSDWAVGAGVIAACLAVPPTLFSLASTINAAAGVVPV
jgi:fission process protein 1